ncbi:MAG TPA: hypothetical protein VFI70_06645 [Nitrososphaeraceae archaeon]|nr:hypothetical protein [Nitrososphaeraceae archaeon]
MHRVERISWPPVIVYVNPNEKLGEDVTLVENVEYKGRACNNIIAQYIIAQYHRFNK